MQVPIGLVGMDVHSAVGTSELKEEKAWESMSACTDGRTLSLGPRYEATEVGEHGNESKDPQ